jgi:N-acetylglucosaminyl-diphospho-decaprenol L-rhamnosyltransferase
MSAAARPWTSIVIVAYNSGDLLQPCLDSLASLHLSAFEVIVVDNCSTDGSIERLHLPDERFRVLPAGENLGFAEGSNRGIAASQAPFVVTLNPDTTVAPDWLSALQRATARHPDVAMFGSTQIDALNPDRLDGCGDAYSFLGMPWRGCYGYPVQTIPPEGETFAPCGAAALYRRETLERVGGFDKAFFCYLEDVDIAFRIRLQGGICVQVPDAVIYHVGSAITGPDSHFTLFHSARNRVWLMIKNLPLPLLAILLPVHLMYLVLTVLRHRGNDVYASSTVAGVRAAFAGLRDVWASRRAIQKRRTVSAFQVMRMISWDPRKLWRCAPDTRAIVIPPAKRSAPIE